MSQDPKMLHYQDYFYYFQTRQSSSRATEGIVSTDSIVPPKTRKLSLLELNQIFEVKNDVPLIVSSLGKS